MPDNGFAAFSQNVSPLLLHDGRKLIRRALHLPHNGCQAFVLKTALILFSSLSFLGYGTACFFSSRMRQEFFRYHLASQRMTVGVLQWFAGVGLLTGMGQPWLGQTAAGGLVLMMLGAIVVRIQIKDTLLQTMPALFYLALNTYLCIAGF